VCNKSREHPLPYFERVIRRPIPLKSIAANATAARICRIKINRLIFLKFFMPLAFLTGKANSKKYNGKECGRDEKKRARGQRDSPPP
jgi:hypothetical protein